MCLHFYTFPLRLCCTYETQETRVLYVELSEVVNCNEEELSHPRPMTPATEDFTRTQQEDIVQYNWVSGVVMLTVGVLKGYFMGAINCAKF